MKDADNIRHARQQAARSLIASVARITLEKTKLDHMLEKAEDATRRAQQQAGIHNAAEHDRRIAGRWYVEATQQLQSSSKAGPGAATAHAGLSSGLPLSPSTPANAYQDPNYPTTYEGYATMETFSLAAIIDNTPALNTQKHALFRAYLHLEENNPHLWTHLYPTGHATVDSIVWYAPLIMAALEELRRMKEPIELERVDLDDLIQTFSVDYLEHKEAYQQSPAYDATH